MGSNVVAPHTAENSWGKGLEAGLKFDDASEAVDSNVMAGFWIRALAFFIDNIVLNLLCLTFFIVGWLAVYLASGVQEQVNLLGRVSAVPVPYNFTMLALAIGYFTYLHGSTGQTIGKMIFQLKVVQKDGNPLSYGRSFLRWAGYLLSGIILNIGFLWAAYDKNKQGWHDKIAQTYVIRL